MRLYAARSEEFFMRISDVSRPISNSLSFAGHEQPPRLKVKQSVRAPSVHRAVLIAGSSTHRARSVEHPGHANNIAPISTNRAQLEQFLAENPVVGIATNPDSFFSLYARSPSTLITARLTEFYKFKAQSTDLNFPEELKAQFGRLEEHTLIPLGDAGIERLALPSDIHSSLEKINDQLARNDYDDLLQRVFGRGVSLDPTLNKTDAKELTLVLVNAARNHTAVLKALEALGNASEPRVRFGTYKSDEVTDIDDLGEVVRISTDPTDQRTIAQIDTRELNAGHATLIPGAFLALRAHEARFPPSESTAAKEAWKLMAADHSYIKGLLPSKVDFSPLDPLPRVQEHVQEARAIADRIDMLQKKEAPFDTFKLDNLRGKLVTVLENLERSLKASVLAHPPLQNLPSRPAPLPPESPFPEAPPAFDPSLPLSET